MKPYATRKTFAKALEALLLRAPDDAQIVGVDSNLHVVSRRLADEAADEALAQRRTLGVADDAMREGSVRVKDPRRVYRDSGGA